MKTAVIGVIGAAGLLLAGHFVKAKIRNDSAIAEDTRRIADALEVERSDRTGRRNMFRERSLLSTNKNGDAYLEPINCNEQINGKDRERVVCTKEL